MQKIDHSDYLKAARENTPVDDKSQLELGGNGWLAGHPIQSDTGTVAIQSNAGWIVVLAESDVIEFAEHDDLHFLRIKYRADAIIRFETIQKISASSPRTTCNCEGAGKASRLQLRQRAGFGRPSSNNGGTLDPDWCVACHYEWVEYLCPLPGTNRYVRCLELEMICENLCDPIPA